MKKLMRKWDLFWIKMSFAVAARHSLFRIEGRVHLARTLAGEALGIRIQSLDGVGRLGIAWGG